jgi:hypothetical protein
MVSVGEYRQFHDDSFRRLPESVAKMAEASMFELITLHDRSGAVLEQVGFDDSDAVAKLMNAVSAQRSVEILDLDGLLDEIDLVMERARDMAVGELRALREDVLAARAG